MTSDQRTSQRDEGMLILRAHTRRRHDAENKHEVRLASLTYVTICLVSMSHMGLVETVSAKHSRRENGPSIFLVVLKSAMLTPMSMTTG